MQSEPTTASSPLRFCPPAGVKEPRLAPSDPSKLYGSVKLKLKVVDR